MEQKKIEELVAILGAIKILANAFHETLEQETLKIEDDPTDDRPELARETALHEGRELKDRFEILLAELDDQIDVLA